MSASPRRDCTISTDRCSTRCVASTPSRCCLRRTFWAVRPQRPRPARAPDARLDHQSIRDVDWCLGGGMMVRGRAVADVGAMDERFFLYFEDVDWCYRMQQRGWRVVYVPDARMQHDYQRASAKGFWPKRGLWIHLLSLVRFYEKWSFLLYWLKLRSAFFRRLALFAVDLAGVVLAFVIAYAIRSYASGLLSKPLFAFHKYYRFLFFAVGSAGAFFILTGLYRTRTRPSFLDNLLAVSRALAWTSLVMMATTFLSSVRVYSRLVVVAFFPLAILIVTALRTALLRFAESFKRHDLNLKRVGLIGPRDEVEALLRRIEQHGRFGIEPVPLLKSEDSAPAIEEVSRLARRVRHERVQEILVFESWTGDLTRLLTALRESGLPLRLVPRLHALMPSDAGVISFYGMPALSLTGGARIRGVGLSDRLLDLSAALGLGLLGVLPFALFLLGRIASRRPIVETTEYRMGGGTMRLRRAARSHWGERGLRALLASIPTLPALARSQVSLIGLYPFTPAEWDALSAEERALAPAGRPGLFGPWNRSDWNVGMALDWNRRIASERTRADELRILAHAFFGA
ncbi:MAG: glycosyltransferase [Candidatus Eisenbacteria bacterium]